jgi:hypothetical protein
MLLQTAAQILATLACGLFAGAALYINCVEHPARMSCGTDLITQWAASYKRATVMQAPLAGLGFLFAIIAWLAGATWWWLIGGTLLGLVVPFTLVVIMPTNKRLLSGQISEQPERVRLLARWNRLHAMRTVLGTVAFVVFLLNI